MESSLDHRKFLKIRSKADLIPGATFLRVIKTGFTTISLDWGEKDNGTTIFVMSTSCEKCDFTVIKTFTEKYKKIKYLLFIESSDKDFIKKQQEVFSFPVYPCKLSVISKELQFYAFPFVFTVNSVGQTISGGIFNSVEILERRYINPLLRVVYADSGR